MEGLIVPQVYVAHVKVGYEDRRSSIERQLQALHVPFQYMLDKDIPDLTAADLQRFTGWIAHPDLRPALSCAAKHLAIYEDLVARNLSGALVLEDDVLLNKDFVSVVNRSLVEARQRSDVQDASCLISYENSSLKFVPRSQSRPGQLLYQLQKLRGTAAYYVSQTAARLMLDSVANEKMSQAIDVFQSTLCASGLIPAYLCQPCVVEQGSFNGTFASTILPRRSGLTRMIRWTMGKRWKQLVSWVL